jgi:POT family proton-dependent oligopeptide transporter
MSNPTSTFHAAGQDARPGAPARDGFFGHPRGLATLFFTEMWERFSYYGMRGILILFMVDAAATGGMGLTDEKAAAIYGLYTAAVYLTALPGGWLADRILGQRSAVFLGGIVIASGHFSMAIPTTATFFLGLALIVIGTGLLKPNVSSIVGDLYPEGGARRDAGFSVFYMGINVGAFVGPIICGLLGEKINWHLGFSAAGIGMVLGLIQYRLGGKYLGDAGYIQPEEAERRPAAVRGLLLGIGLAAAIVVALALLQSSGMAHITFEGVAKGTAYVILGVAVLYFGSVLAFGELTGTEKKRIVVIFLLFLAAALFWSGFEQAGSSMNLFAERLTDRFVFGWEAPASALQAVNPLFIILLAPVFGSLWMWLSARKREPSIPAKFGAGLLLLAVSFLVMMWAATGASETHRVTPFFLVAAYFFQTCGELSLSPVGLSSVTKLAPKRLVSQMMGTWFMGSALGNLVAGLVAGQFQNIPLPTLFGRVALWAAAGGFLMLLFTGGIKKLIGSVR